MSCCTCTTCTSGLAARTVLATAVTHFLLLRVETFPCLPPARFVCHHPLLAWLRHAALARQLLTSLDGFRNAMLPRLRTLSAPRGSSAQHLDAAVHLVPFKRLLGAAVLPSCAHQHSRIFDMTALRFCACYAYVVA